jgi:hypothetical protein
MILMEKEFQGLPFPITQSKSVWNHKYENGDFTVSVPRGTTISFTMIGFTTVSRTINEAQNNWNIRMKESSSY